MKKARLVPVIFFFMIGCSFSMYSQRINFRHVFKANNVEWLKKIKIDKTCIEKVKSDVESSLKTKLSDYDCYKSNSFERAIHFWSTEQPFKKKRQRVYGKDYLVIINEDCTIKKITIDQ